MTDTQTEGQGAEAAEGESLSVLEQAIGATKQTERDETQDLLKNLTEQAMSGTVAWDKNLTVTMKNAIDAIDAQISKQLAAIMHNEKFQKLEGSWRGMNHLVMNSETGSGLKIKMLNLSKRELFKDLDKAVEFDQSQIFKKIYESEFGTAGGEPYGAMIGDFQFTNNTDDIDLLNNMSHVAAGAFCPFVSAASPAMFGFDDFKSLSKPSDLEQIS